MKLVKTNMKHKKHLMSISGIVAFVVLMTIPFSLCCMIPHKATSTNYPPNYQKTVLQRKSVVKVNIDIDAKICTIMAIPSDNSNDPSKPVCKETKLKSSGSGTVIAKTKSGSLILTANHVCNLKIDLPFYLKAEKLIVTTSVLDLDGKEYKTKIVNTDEKEDLCVLRAEGLNAAPINISQDPPEEGDRVFNMSFPRGLYAQNMVLIFEGFYAGLFPIGENVYSSYSIFAAGGSSGSSILNLDGEIIGMIHSGLNSMEHFALSPQFLILRNFLLDSIIKNQGC